MNIPFIDCGGAGKELLFLHANGYPPVCYLPLLTKLSETFHVKALVQRPLWPESQPEEIQNWLPLTDDLLQYLQANHSEPIVCIGHSLGGSVLLRAALRSPERFKAIALVDPVLFPPIFVRVWGTLKKLNLLRRFHPLIAGAGRRRREFDNLERLFNAYRRRPVFRYFDDHALQGYIEGIACKNENGGYRLCYSPEWEVHIYLTGIWADMDIWRGLPSLRVPTLIVRGVETDTFWERTGRMVQRKQPQVRVEAVDQSTHLVPLEKPIEVSNLIQSFFKESV